MEDNYTLILLGCCCWVVVTGWHTGWLSLGGCHWVVVTGWHTGWLSLGGTLGDCHWVAHWVVVTGWHTGQYTLTMKDRILKKLEFLKFHEYQNIKIKLNHFIIKLLELQTIDFQGKYKIYTKTYF